MAARRRQGVADASVLQDIRAVAGLDCFGREADRLAQRQVGQTTQEDDCNPPWVALYQSKRAFRLNPRVRGRLVVTRES